MSKSLILDSISQHYPFPFSMLLNFYEIHKSLDTLVEVCEFAAQAGSGDIFWAYTEMVKSREGDRMPILCLDFDGVCHSYTSGWKGADHIPDPPVAGLFEFLEEASKVFDVQVYSARSHMPGGIDAMQEWFVSERNQWMLNGHESAEPLTLTFPIEKPSAFVGLDDRILTFVGTFPAIEELKAFKPWWSPNA